MKKLHMYLGTVAAALCAGAITVSASAAAPTKVEPLGLSEGVGEPLASMQAMQFHSAISDEDVRLFVSLPAGYDKTQARYPVLYMLDGNRGALMAALIRDRLGSDIEPMIIVGIGYKIPLAEAPAPQVTQRWLNYPTPAASYWNVPADRGAPQFYKVLSQEILPYIDGAYRTKPGDRGLGGHSMGGFFATWALFNSKDMFQRYWISSPSLVWDNKVLDRIEADYASRNTDLKARVFADVGAVEASDMTVALETLGDRVQSRGYPGLKWDFHLAKDLGHSVAQQESAPYALYALYGQEVATLPSARMRALVGRYALPSGKSFSIRAKDGTLYLEGNDSSEIPLSDTKLFPLADGRLMIRYVRTTLQTKTDGDLVQEIAVSAPGAGGMKTTIFTRVAPGTAATR